MITMTAPDRPVAPQTFGVVLSAELARMIRPGGIRLGILLTFAASVLCGIGTSFLVRYLGSGTEAPPEGSGALEVTLPVEISAGVCGIVFAVLFAVYVARDVPAGLMQTALTLVPNRSRLLSARWVAVALAGGAGALASTSATAVAVIMAGGSVPEKIQLALSGVAASTVAVSLLVSIAFFIAILVRRPVPTLMTVLGLLVVAPLALSVLQASLPADISQITGSIVSATPAPLFFQAVGTSATLGSGAGSLLLAHAFMGMWALILGFISMTALKRQDF